MPGGMAAAVSSMRVSLRPTSLKAPLLVRKVMGDKVHVAGMPRTWPQYLRKRTRCGPAEWVPSRADAVEKVVVHR
jgi:hypothetical protein